MPDNKRVFKGIVAGMAGGMVASWAVNRFYNLARESSEMRSMVPYLVGAGIGAAYATIIERVEVPMIARVPLGAAVYLGEPEKHAAPPSGGRDMPERARNIALRLASRGLRKVAEKALHA